MSIYPLTRSLHRGRGAEGGSVWMLRMDVEQKRAEATREVQAEGLRPAAVSEMFEVRQRRRRHSAAFDWPLQARHPPPQLPPRLLRPSPSALLTRTTQSLPCPPLPQLSLSSPLSSSSLLRSAASSAPHRPSPAFATLPCPLPSHAPCGSSSSLSSSSSFSSTSEAAPSTRPLTERGAPTHLLYHLRFPPLLQLPSTLRFSPFG